MAEGTDPVVWHLHRAVRSHHPGGGFGGGVIIACAFILITLALGEKNGLDIFSKGLASKLDSGGLLIFLAVGWLGTWWASGYFFENFMATPQQS